MKVAVLLSFFIYVVLFVILQQIIGRMRGARNIRRHEYPMFPVYRGIAMMLLWPAVYTMKNDSFNSLRFVRLTGFVIVGLGLILSMYAQYKLGKNWVGGIGIHKNHQLITTGPYKYVRHPLYTGMLVSAIGLCLVSLNVFYGLMGLVFAGAYALRSIFEDIELQKKFKKKYDAYASQTGSLFPILRKRG